MKICFNFFLMLITTVLSSCLLTSESRADVRVLALEVNQAVQDTLFYPGAPGSVTLGESTIPIVLRRNTAVRAYVVGAHSTPLSGFQAVLRVTFWPGPGDESPVTRNYLPVNEAGQIDLEADAAAGGAPDPAQLQRLRFDLRHTLNFVIPQTAFGGEHVGFTLWESGTAVPLPLHGQVQVRLDAPVSIGVNVVRILRPDPPRPLVPVTFLDILNVPSQLKMIYPVSDARVIRTQDWRYDGEPNDDALLSALWRTFGGELTPRGGFPGPNVVTTLGMARGLFDNVGLAFYFGKPDQTPPALRRGGVSISIETLLGYGHEIGHTLGLEHFGRSFDADPASFGYPETQPEFAITTQFTDLHAALGIELSQQAGRWTLSRPGASTPNPSLDPRAGGPYDIMSYGVPGWISDLTYRRIYEVIRFGAPLGAAMRMAASLPDDNEPMTETMLVGGMIQTNGAGRLLPVLHKQMPVSLLAVDQVGGSYRVELLGSDGELLRAVRFNARPMADDPQKSVYFDLALPVVDGARSLRLYEENRLVSELTASAQPPVPQVMSMAVVGQGEDRRLRIAWQASDADGDPVTTLVQVSYDYGATWLGVALSNSRDLTEAETPLLDPQDAGKALFRVIASDGLNVTSVIRRAPPGLRIRRTVTCEWNCGVLQAADSVGGPYVDVLGVTSPYTTELGPGHRFFRVRLP